jgi:hypothetical protein
MALLQLHDSVFDCVPTQETFHHQQCAQKQCCACSVSPGCCNYLGSCHVLKGTGSILGNCVFAVHSRFGLYMVQVVASATHMSMRLLRDERCRINLVAAGCVPKLVSLLEHPDALIQSNAVGALTEAIKIPSASTALQEAKIIKKLISMLERPVLVGPPAEGEAPGLEPAPVLLVRPLGHY